MAPPARILLGITGGIAAYKTPALIRLLRQHDFEVRTVLTPCARGFVGIEALRTVSGNPVSLDSPDASTGPYAENLEHIRLAEWADCMLIAPATANTIAKIAHGIADNLLTTLALCFHGARLVVAPAMNSAMWLNPATVENVAVMRKHGVRILPVGVGELACGTSGPGRMVEVDEIVDCLAIPPDAPSLAGKRVLIASGPTAEPIDPVRVITNRSSGKMGAALARAALAMGAEVTVVSGPAREPLPRGAHVVGVITAAEMLAALTAEYENADVCIMAAAVADFRAATVSDVKLARRENVPVILTLAPNPDIARALGERTTRQFLVGFALESDGSESRARAKMAEKQCSMMILNQPGESLERDDARVTILSRDGRSQAVGPMSKLKIAIEILTAICREMGARA